MKISGKQVTKAGETLIDNTATRNEKENAYDILSQWRACHEIPLEKAKDLLTAVSRSVDKKAVIAWRRKRAVSIIRKLERNRHKRSTLRTIQDIGGCRAIVKNEKAVRKIVRTLKKKKSLSIDDYIKKPKYDGYRGVHLVGNFSNDKKQRRRIELQVRTKAQHSWATAVEIVDLFTGQNLKTKKTAISDWSDFFKHASYLIANLEAIPAWETLNLDVLVKILLSQMNDDKVLMDSFEKLYILSNKIDATKKLLAFQKTLQITGGEEFTKPTDGYLLLKINTSSGRLQSWSYEEKDFIDAEKKYIELEKSTKDNSSITIALISTDSADGIKDAYPNYFADSADFLSYVQFLMECYRFKNPDYFSRYLKKLIGK